MEFDTLLKEAESILAGSEGLLFLPYFSGENFTLPGFMAIEKGCTIRMFY